MHSRSCRRHSSSSICGITCLPTKTWLCGNHVLTKCASAATRSFNVRIDGMDFIWRNAGKLAGKRPSEWLQNLAGNGSSTRYAVWNIEGREAKHITPVDNSEWAQAPRGHYLLPQRIAFLEKHKKINEICTHREGVNDRIDVLRTYSNVQMLHLMQRTLKCVKKEIRFYFETVLQ